MIILEDKAQQIDKHLIKNHYWKLNGIEVIRVPLPVGDYIIANDKVLDVIIRKGQRNTEIKKMDFVGTYNTVVDTKKDMQEIYGDIVGKQHARFRDECILAQNNNVKLIILVENEDGVESLEEVHKWENPRATRYCYFKKLKDAGKAKNVKLSNRPPCSSRQLQTAMETMQEKYGVEFLFCTPGQAGAKVIELLTT